MFQKNHSTARTVARILFALGLALGASMLTTVIYDVPLAVAENEAANPQTIAAVAKLLGKKTATSDTSIIQSAEVSESSDFFSVGKRVAQGLIYCLGAFLLGASLYKKYSPVERSARNEIIEIESRRMLTAKTGLLIVSIEGERLLLSQSESDIRFLTKLSADQPALPVANKPAALARAQGDIG